MNSVCSSEGLLSTFEECFPFGNGTDSYQVTEETDYYCFKMYDTNYNFVSSTDINCTSLTPVTMDCQQDLYSYGGNVSLPFSMFNPTPTGYTVVDPLTCL